MKSNNVSGLPLEECDSAVYVVDLNGSGSRSGCPSCVKFCSADSVQTSSSMCHKGNIETLANDLYGVFLVYIANLLTRENCETGGNRNVDSGT